MEYLTSFLLQKIRNSNQSELDLTNNSESSSEEEIILVLQREQHVRICTYVNRVALNYSHVDFQKHFRITRASFEQLLCVLKPQKNIIAPGRPGYPLLDSLLLCLWTVSTQESFREIGDRFGLSEGHAYRVFMHMCKKLSNLHYKYIVWPKGNKAQENVNDFNCLRGVSSFPNVFGCVDGTHIPIPGPLNDNSYYNRKGYHSVLLQGICNSKLEFINIYCGWPGSVNDARVWQGCEVFQKLNENLLSLLLPNTYLLGDCAYPLSTFMMVPFKDNGHLSRKQHQFNAKLSKTRVAIEQAFGRLKGQFRRLKYLNIWNLKNAKYIITTACVLHNIGIEGGVEYTEAEDHQTDDMNDTEDYIPQRTAVDLRNIIMNSM